MITRKALGFPLIQVLQLSSIYMRHGIGKFTAALSADCSASAADKSREVTRGQRGSRSWLDLTLIGLDSPP